MGPSYPLGPRWGRGAGWLRVTCQSTIWDQNSGIANAEGASAASRPMKRRLRQARYESRVPRLARVVDTARRLHRGLPCCLPDDDSVSTDDIVIVIALSAGVFGFLKLTCRNQTDHLAPSLPEIKKITAKIFSTHTSSNKATPETIFCQPFGGHGRSKIRFSLFPPTQGSPSP
jgi:hypothetical protein